ncbi:MAG TPA: SdpI family protein [Casimicrobiaceae bacterium]|nr:SdpI family protein [Casimicrobiaceae bacterium]
MSAQIPLLVACAVTAVIAIPLILRRVPPNSFYGFRTPRTLADRDLWFRVNHFAGWALLIASIASAILLMLGPPPPNALLFVGPLGLALVVSLVYLRHCSR